MRTERLYKELTKIVNPYTVFICMGNPKSKLNSAGPEIGSVLESMHYIVYGTKERPYTSNMAEIIEKRHKNANIITINCSMANVARDVGKIRLKNASLVNSPIIFTSFFDQERNEESQIKHYLLSICTVPANESILLKNDELEVNANKNYYLSLMEDNIDIVKNAIIQAMNFSHQLLKMKREIKEDEEYLRENIKELRAKITKIQNKYDVHRYYRKDEIAQLNNDLSMAQHLLIENESILKHIDRLLDDNLKEIDKQIY